jgi:hypothetical protein
MRFPRFFGVQVTLSKAARLMYRRIEGSYYDRMISGSERTPEAKLEWMVNSLLAVRDDDDRRVRFYAKKPPSNISLLIAEKDLKRMRWKVDTDELYQEGARGRFNSPTCWSTGATCAGMYGL